MYWARVKRSGRDGRRCGSSIRRRTKARKIKTRRTTKLTEGDVERPRRRSGRYENARVHRLRCREGAVERGEVKFAELVRNRERQGDSVGKHSRGRGCKIRFPSVSCRSSVGQRVGRSPRNRFGGDEVCFSLSLFSLFSLPSTFSAQTRSTVWTITPRCPPYSDIVLQQPV